MQQRVVAQLVRKYDVSEVEIVASVLIEGAEFAVWRSRREIADGIVSQAVAELGDRRGGRDAYLW